MHKLIYKFKNENIILFQMLRDDNNKTENADLMYVIFFGDLKNILKVAAIKR